MQIVEVRPSHLQWYCKPRPHQILTIHLDSTLFYLFFHSNHFLSMAGSESPISLTWNSSVLLEETQVSTETTFTQKQMSKSKRHLDQLDNDNRKRVGSIYWFHISFFSITVNVVYSTYLVLISTSHWSDRDVYPFDLYLTSQHPFFSCHAFLHCKITLLYVQ